MQFWGCSFCREGWGGGGGLDGRLSSHEAFPTHQPASQPIWVCRSFIYAFFWQYRQGYIRQFGLDVEKEEKGERWQCSEECSAPVLGHVLCSIAR